MPPLDPDPRDDDAIAHLFEREMDLLLRGGAAFAQGHPDAAGLLDPGRATVRDPTVDRLAEAFAFLSARIRQAVLGEEPALATHLRDLLVGDLDEPLPSVAVVEGSAEEGPLVLPRGTPLLLGSRPPRRWRFELGQELIIRPLRVSRARVVADGEDASALELAILRAGAPRAWPARLLFHLHGDASTAWSLRHALCRRVRSIEILRNGVPEAAPGLRFRSARAPAYAANPQPHPLSEARDLLCCDERFRFVELEGLDSLDPGPEEVSMRIRLLGQFPRTIARAVGPTSLRLNCAVAVNRWEGAFEGATWDHSRAEIPLQPPGGAELLRAGEVCSIARLPAGSTRRTLFLPLRSHRHEHPFHHLRTERGTALLSLGWPRGGGDLTTESVAVSGMFCDGDHPHLDAPSGDSTAAVPGQPGIRLLVLGRPTPIFRSPADDSRQRFRTVVSTRFEGLLDLRRLREALRLFLWDPTAAKLPLLASLREVAVEPATEGPPGERRRTLRVAFRLEDPSCAPGTWERLGLLDAFSEVLSLLAREETPLGWASRSRIVVEPCGIELPSSFGAP